MTVTRAQVETIVVKRAGGLMSLAGLAVTYAGANADLNDPIGWAIRTLDGTVTDPTAVTDTDVATVPAADLDDLLNLTEYRILKNILGNLALVDISVGPRSNKYDQLRQAVLTRLAQLKEELASIVGSTLEAGIITLDFAEHEDTTA